MTTPFRLETERLWLREFALEDAPRLLLLNSDPEVLRFTGDVPFAGLETAQAFISSYDQYRLYGHGRWAVITKADGLCIGWCGLKFRPETGETDLGYRLLRNCWGQGYATEAGAACLRYGFQTLGLTRIIARAMPQNSASLRVIKKLGMYYECTSADAAHPWVQHALTAAQWQAHAGGYRAEGIRHPNAYH